MGIESLAVVVVNFDTRDQLRACLRTVLREGAASVVVADNGSSDGSVEMVRREFPGVVLDVDPRNPGYGAGANRGIRRSGEADVLVLNSDTCLHPGALDGLARYAGEHPRAGIVGPRLLHPDGTLQRSCFRFPSPLRPPLGRDPIGRLAHRIPALRERCLATWAHDAPRIVPWVLGAALFLRRAALRDVGGFDEAFFLYAEEIDLCFRARTHGWETHFTPAAQVTHAVGGSTRRHRAAMLAQGCESAMLFYRRHYSGRRLLMARSMMIGAMAWRALRDSVRYGVSADRARRAVLAENIAVWRGSLKRCARVAPLLARMP